MSSGAAVGRNFREASGHPPGVARGCGGSGSGARWQYGSSGSCQVSTGEWEKERIAERQNGRMAEYQDGRMVEWQSGRVVEC